jgi:hypothetical protein
MPFQSKKQMKWAFATGKLGKGKAEEWAHETPDISGLPEHKKPKKEDADERALRRIAAGK